MSNVQLVRIARLMASSVGVAYVARLTDQQWAAEREKKDIGGDHYCACRLAPKGDWLVAARGKFATVEGARCSSPAELALAMLELSAAAVQHGR